MKKILLLIGVLILISNIGYAEFLGIKQSSETVSFFLKPPLDSLYGIQRKPDSVHIFTYADNATAHTYAARSTTYPFSDISIDTLKHFSDTMYVFADAIADIDGAGGHFTLAINVQMYYDKIPTHTYATVQIVADSLNMYLVDINDTVNAILDTLQLWDTRIDSIEAAVSDAAKAAIGDTVWNKVLTGATFNIQNSAGKILRQIKGGSVIHDGTSDNTPANGANSFSLETGGGSPTTSTIDNFYNHQRLAIVDGTGEGQLVLISDYTGSNQVATVTPAFLTTPDATSVYEILPGLVHAETQGGGYEDGAVWVSSSGSAGTQLYVDGTIDNPIDDGSFANAKTVADALGITTFRMETGSEITLATTYNNYDFKGTAWHLALGGQDLGHSNIHGAEVSGTATGSNVIQFFDCIMDSLTISPTNFYRCGFGETVDSVTASAPGTYIFRDCYSIISGIVTPKFSLGDAVANVNFGFRNYDGGIELSEIGSLGNDSVSIEGNGNLILNASNVGGQLVIRGNWTITDNSSTTTITRDAVFNRIEVSTPIADTVNVMIKYFDTLIYQGCVWVDAGANTNTVIGVDGVPSNPVGTIAAAKTIADNLGIYNICLLDAASETIGETMEHYKFCGLTRSAVIDLGGQDVDGSFFTNLTVTGEQGGTGLIVVTNSGLSNADSLEIHARNCAIIGNLSLRAGDNFFDKCYSSVAGNATPVLDFNDVNTTVNVSWRAYSGGLEVQNMTTDHTMSYETDGQLVVNANSDNANITIRGMCSITDNGTDMNITKDAVFNRAEVSDPIADTSNAILDSIQDVMGVDAIEISGDATAANNFETMLDGTGGQIFSLRGLHIRGTAGNDTAFIAHGFGGGIGGSFYGGATNAHGLYAKGQGSGAGFGILGGSSGNGLNIVGLGAGNGTYSVGGANGHGLHVQSQGIGKSIFMSGSGTMESSAATVFMSNMYEDLWDEISTGCIVEADGANSVTQVQTNLGEATDNHYNGAMIFFIDGTEVGTYRRITDYTGASGVLVWDPAVLTAPAAGDSIRIMPWASVSASATISAADMGAIADSVHDKDTTDAFAVASGFGKFVKDSTQGSAAGLTKEDVADAVMDSLGAGTRPIEITRLWVNAAANDPAVSFTGSGTGSALELVSGATASYSLYCASAATNGLGAFILGKGTAPGLSISGGTGAGGNGVNFTAGTGSNGHGLQLTGKGIGVDMKLVTSGTISDGTNTVLMTSDIPITPTDTTESGYSIVCNGIGARTIRIYAVDSTGTDSVMSGINIEVKDQSDNQYVYNRTTNGYIQFNATENDTFLVYGFGEPAHTFPGDTASAGAPATIGHDSIFVTVGGDITDTIWAYDNNVAAPGSADLSRVYYDVFDLVGQPMYKKTQMVVELFNNNRVMRDTCNNTSIGTYVAEAAKANSAGRIQIDLRKNKCYDDPTIVYHAYLQIGGRRGVKLDIGDFIVRDSSTQMLKIEDD